MKISDSEFLALHQAIDLLESVMNGTDNLKYYKTMSNKLKQIFRKAKKERK